jgi:hypothetical protein
MGAGHEALGIELDFNAGAVRVPTVRLRRLTLALELFLGLAQRGPPARARPQPLRQLVAARLAIELVLAPVYLHIQNTARDPSPTPTMLLIDGSDCDVEADRASLRVVVIDLVDE